MPSLRRRKWNRLASGLYVPPFIGRLLPKVPKAEFAGYPCCRPGRTCSLCDVTDGVSPLRQQVVLAGYAEPACGSCASVNDIYVLTQAEAPTTACRWIYQFPSPLCLIDTIRLDIVKVTAIDFFMRVALLEADLSSLGTFIKDYDGSPEPPCSPNNLQLPRVGIHFIDCDTSAATCFVTGL